MVHQTREWWKQAIPSAASSVKDGDKAVRCSPFVTDSLIILRLRRQSLEA
jgi:hypothetical protein